MGLGTLQGSQLKLWQAERLAVRQHIVFRAQPGPTKEVDIIENRRRNETLTVRLTKSEKRAIQTKVKKSGLTMSDYFVKVSAEKQINIIDVKPVLTELKKLGANINQMARKMNSGFFRPKNFDEVIKNQNIITELFSEIMEKL